MKFWQSLKMITGRTLIKRRKLRNCSTPSQINCLTKLCRLGNWSRIIRVRVEMMQMEMQQMEMRACPNNKGVAVEFDDDDEDGDRDLDQVQEESETEEEEGQEVVGEANACKWVESMTIMLTTLLWG